jgi:hypothetical protein
MHEFTYIFVENELGSVIHRSDGASIPVDTGNKDYLAYLAQLEGKEPTLPEITETPEAE